jgi:hypothetical protein
LIKECPTILATGKASEIRAIKQELGDSYDGLIKEYPSILAKGKASEIRAIKQELGDSYDSLIKECPSILLNREERLEKIKLNKCNGNKR